MLRGEPGQRDPATRGVRQRASEVLRQPGTRSTTPRRGGSHQGVAALGSRPHRSAGGVEREWSKQPKLGTAPSSALHLGPGRRKTGWRRSRSRVSARRAAAVGEAQATRSGIRRSTGARVVSRLQKSARSIFLTPSRGAARQTEEARGSTSRRFLPRQGGITPWRVKGCEAEVRKPNRERNEASLDRKVEDRVDGRRPGSMRPSRSNRRGGSSGPGHGGKLSAQRKKGKRAANARGGAHAVAPSRRQRTSEIASSW